MAILSYRTKETERFHADGVAPRAWRAFARQALRKLDMIDAAEALGELAILPGNRLETLRGDRKGQYSIRINDQFRVCFFWTGAGAEDVEIIDYH